MSYPSYPPFASTSTPFGVYITYTRRPSPKNRILAAQHVWEATSNNVVIATLIVDDSVVRASNKGTGAVVDCKFVLYYLQQSTEQRITIRFSKQVCKLTGLNIERIVERNAGTGEVLRVVTKRYVRKLLRFAL
ncbi:hypothetical protein PC9H_010197 [Pleurotus ostreatus]|uniref:Uncharacterized protein n=1 Tax=Pleurotus ostreatus TaxID=5322 RepID=A0A8H7DST6_PLEOS|nr:uncharacterized protein PC9H_010197 [Pleurotus ostreatus]KAF7424886.1 hypothetical protein PC9H_010197 [Pleurotus ostreatus]KAJ8692091.1 hypothetical protein PTI98_009432 [Pleurotus ostreatus]